MYNKIVLGIDQSYSRLGLCILADRKKKALKSIDMKRFANNTLKRAHISNIVVDVLRRYRKSSNEFIIVVERIRQFSNGTLSINYLKSIGALNAAIVDAAQQSFTNVFSVDTRAWKAAVIGSSKPMSNDYAVNPAKWQTINWCREMGWADDILIELPLNSRREKGIFKKVVNGIERKFEWDNDAADAAGIAMSGFILPQKKLKLEH